MIFQRQPAVSSRRVLAAQRALASLRKDHQISGRRTGQKLRTTSAICSLTCLGMVGEIPWSFRISARPTPPPFLFFNFHTDFGPSLELSKRPQQEKEREREMTIATAGAAMTKIGRNGHNKRSPSHFAQLVLGAPGRHRRCTPTRRKSTYVTVGSSGAPRKTEPDATPLFQIVPRLPPVVLFLHRGGGALLSNMSSPRSHTEEK